MGSRWLGACLGLTLALSTTIARAETPPDLVLLENGGMVRGTIQELIPDDKVTIELSDGTKRTYKMGEVRFAGPSERAPKPEKAEVESPAAEPEPKAVPAPGLPPAAAKESTTRAQIVTLHGAEARLKLEADPAGLTFHRKSVTAIGGGRSARGYDVMCTAPCEVSMPQGTHTLALSVGSGPPMEAAPVTLTGDSTLRGRFVSRSGLRTLGGVLVASTLGSTLAIISDEAAIRALGYIWLGGGLLAGGILLYQRDSVTIEVLNKLTLPVHRTSRVGGDQAISSSPWKSVRGLSVRARF